MGQTFSGPSVNDPLGYDVFLREDIATDGRAATGLELVSNAILHRLTTGMLLLIGAAEGETDFGEDARTWCGATITEGQANARGPQVAAIIQRDPRIDTCDVTVALAGPSTGYTLTMTIEAKTVTGQTIDLIVGVSSIAVDILAEGQ